MLFLCPRTGPASLDNTEKQVESSQSQIEATIISLERQLWDGDVSRNPAPSRELVADDFEGIKHGLLYTLEDDGAVANQYRLRSYTITEARVRLVRPDVALITYRVTWTGSFAGIELPQQPFYIASLWTTRVDRWKNIFAAETQPDFATKAYKKLTKRVLPNKTE